MAASHADELIASARSFYLTTVPHDGDNTTVTAVFGVSSDEDKQTLDSHIKSFARAIERGETDNADSADKVWTDAETAAYTKGADDGYEAGRYVALQEAAIAVVAPEDQIGYQLGQIAGLHGASGPAQLAAERALYEFFSRGIEDYDLATVASAVKSAICDAIEEAAKVGECYGCDVGAPKVETDGGTLHSFGGSMAACSLTPLEEWEEMESKIPDSTDAWVWAKAFMKLFGQDLATLATVDEGLMIGWFANAIESGRRAGEKTEFLAKADETYASIPEREIPGDMSFMLTEKNHNLIFGPREIPERIVESYRCDTRPDDTITVPCAVEIYRSDDDGLWRNLSDNQPHSCRDDDIEDMS